MTPRMGLGSERWRNTCLIRLTVASPVRTSTLPAPQMKSAMHSRVKVIPGLSSSSSRRLRSFGRNSRPERLATPWSGPYSRKTTFDRSEGRFVGRTSLPIEAQRVASTPDSSDERVGLSISQSLSQTCDTHCDSAPRIGAPTKRSVAAAAA